MCVWSVSNPHFIAIEDPLVATLNGISFHTDNITSCIGFTHGQGAYEFAGTQFGQVFQLLLVVSMSFDLSHVQGAMGGVGESDRPTCSAHFLHYHAMARVV